MSRRPDDDPVLPFRRRRLAGLALAPAAAPWAATEARRDRIVASLVVGIDPRAGSRSR